MPPIPDTRTCTNNQHTEFPNLHTTPKPNDTELIKETKKHNRLGKY